MPRAAWTLALVLVAMATPAAAQPLAPLDPLPPSAASAATRPNHPPPILEAPIAVGSTPVRPALEPPPTAESFATPAGFPERTAARPGRSVGLGTPTIAGQAVTVAAVPVLAAETPVRPAAGTEPGAAIDPVNELLTRRTRYNRKTHDRGDEPAPRSSHRFGERLEGILGQQGEWFRSDHAFDGFISPVSNPFLFEDPRSLTELRPIYIYQRIPSGQRDFLGGNISYFGTQARLAVTERLSFTFNKLGGIWLNPSDNSTFGDQSGFAELWFGPKYTFIRNADTCSLLASGLLFQVPVGGGAFQNTGSLSLVPYVSYAQNFLPDLSIGSLNVMATTGYSFGTSKARSDYYYLSGHIDLDVHNKHCFYPLFEMNYYVYTKDGNTLPIGAEGRDLFNFGGQAAGKGLLTGAFGARYKFTECAQVGGTFEIPFAGPRDLFQYRFTLDFIWRY